MSEPGAPLVRFSDAGKAYRRRHLKSFLLHDLWPGRSTETAATDDYWAIRHVSFDLVGGDSVALFGTNGSGKSTTLALAAGASHPSEGRVSVRGRVAPVLALGVGFEPDMTAPENAYINASLLGVGREEAQQRLEQILAFADLRDFVDVPVRNYSTGMVARLGFGVAMHVDADVLLIDEVLSVGDGAFQKKCIGRLESLREQGRTLLVVTHELEMAERLCTRALWLKSGELHADGPLAEVLPEYRRFLASLAEGAPRASSAKE
ncbi:MAG: ABC transporter ATP-binding protein [Polyangiaceae bacterium]|nr:ABC transporter ATP-binding protein [Polyangiaceae bacterium]